MFEFSLLGLCATTLSLVAAAPGQLPSSSQLAAPEIAKRCVNSASDRSCWGDYSLSTDYYDIDAVPDTGVVREYWFNVENGTAAPDGIERTVLTVNGSVPGPTIIADWGDTVVVHVTNSMQNNGTGIHFHGVRQLNNTQNDGVPSITQCPIAPGDTLTYTWKATQYGSSWWHSHFYVQAWDGVLGGILINGPATANYDEDLGNLFLMDWSHNTADQVLLTATFSDTAVVMPTSLINGTNVYNNSGVEVGSRFETTFEAGKKYRLRLVNSGASNHFRFMIDNHTMEVISADFVPIHPYNTTDLSIGAGERYDVVVTASSQEGGNFWMRSIPQTNCTKTTNVNDVLGIVRYTASSANSSTAADADSAATSLPTTTAYAYTDTCADEDPANLVPYLVSDPAVTYDVRDDEVTAVINGDVVSWTMGGSSFQVDWANPSLQQVLDADNSGVATNWTADQHALVLPNANKWVYMYIQTTSAQAHPIHLHGHDFWVLASGWGSYATVNPALSFTNAPRRDVAMVPGDGYLVIAFLTDNPGTWLLHCHIAWHTSEGFAMQIIERESEILPMIDEDQMNSTCANWDAYANIDDVVQWDSGV
ncbi:laccase 3 [Coniella lustricola]|uniref:Laccase 3 n=1 Tax=Coniella lustricola TaxID=2025994 RepID=A0A2T3A7A1_9PEZI|nr:laccase 3 [Coniella lustricola]